LNPDFDPGSGHVRQQIRSAESFLRVEKWVVDRLEKLDPRPDLSQENSVELPTGSFQTIFKRSENQTIESLYNAVGPTNPFVGLPVLNDTQLDPGDIIVTSSSDSISQAIRIATWSRFSHAVLYVGDGMVEQADARGVTIEPLETLLSHVSQDGVIRDLAIDDMQRAAVVADAIKYEGRPYNYAGLAAIAIKKAERLNQAANPGIRSIISVLTKPETIPDFLADGHSFFCSQLVVTAYADAGVPLHTTNGASPGDIVRLSEYDATLEELGSLPAGASQ
jgi:cell wall-associated NlpC family hydrolase